MTVVGKILVFVNLLFSLVVGGLIIMIFVAQTKWKENSEKWQKSYVAADRDSQQSREELVETRRTMDKTIAELTAKFTKAEGDLKIVEKSASEATAALKAEKLRYNHSFDPPLVASKVQVESAAGAVSNIEKQMQELTARNITLVKDNADLRAQAVTAQIDARSALRRAQEVEEKFQELAKENVRIKSIGSGGTTSPGSRVLAKNPPPENVEGIITRSDTGSGLVVISIGSDSGLEKGHTLEVFRLNPNKYLGTIQIMDVRPHEAVGKPTTRMLGPIQQGDRVAAKILGG
jgi:hypothetical protein